MSLSEIFSPGNIVRVNDYEFEDGGRARDKYLVVVTTTQEAVIIHSLTTSKNNLGLNAEHFGCAVVNDIPFFFFPAGQIIGEGDFYFDRDTFVFFNGNIREKPLAAFQGKQEILDFAKVGQLTSEKHKQFIKCILKSKYVPTKFKQLLEQLKLNLGN